MNPDLQAPPAGEGWICTRCTGVFGAHYLTCPTLRVLPPAPQRAAPGSYEAAAQGCCCPVRDNNHGKRPPGGWRITEGCPVHDGTGAVIR